MLRQEFIPQNFAAVFDKSTVAVSIPQCFPKGGAIIGIIPSKYRLNGFGGLRHMIVRHVREQVVSYMAVREVVEHIVQDSIISVDCAQRALKPSPFLVGVVRYSDIGVLQVGDYHQPHVNIHKGYHVQTHQPPE